MLSWAMDLGIPRGEGREGQKLLILSDFSPLCMSSYSKTPPLFLGSNIDFFWGSLDKIGWDRSWKGSVSSKLQGCVSIHGQLPTTRIWGCWSFCFVFCPLWDLLSIHISVLRTCEIRNILLISPTSHTW